MSSTGKPKFGKLEKGQSQKKKGPRKVFRKPKNTVELTETKLINSAKIVSKNHEHDVLTSNFSTESTKPSLTMSISNTKSITTTSTSTSTTTSTRTTTFTSTSTASYKTTPPQKPTIVDLGGKR